MKNVFIISGGGIRGIIAANGLCKLAQEKPGLKPDLVVGTSVGAILGGYIAIGNDYSNVVEIFKDMAHRIFGKKRLFPPRYNAEEAVQCLEELYNGAKVSDVKVPLLIATAELVRNETVYLSTNSRWAADKTLAQFVQPSFSAPFYFEHVAVPKKRRILSDGGVGYNNFPIMPGFVEMLKHDFLSHTCDIYAFGTGNEDGDDIFIQKEYDKLAKNKWIYDVIKFFSLRSAGFARESSYREQINAGINIGKTVPNLTFTYFDAKVGKPFNYDFDDVRAIEPLEKLEIFEIVSKSKLK